MTGTMEVESALPTNEEEPWPGRDRQGLQKRSQQQQLLLTYLFGGFVTL